MEELLSHAGWRLNKSFQSSQKYNYVGSYCSYHKIKHRKPQFNYRTWHKSWQVTYLSYFLIRSTITLQLTKNPRCLIQHTTHYIINFLLGFCGRCICNEIQIDTPPVRIKTTLWLNLTNVSLQGMNFGTYFRSNMALLLQKMISTIYFTIQQQLWFIICKTMFTISQLKMYSKTSAQDSPDIHVRTLGTLSCCIPWRSCSSFISEGKQL